MEKDQLDYMEKSLKTRFVLNKILKKENIHADESILEAETSALMEYRKDLDAREAKAYVESMLLNEKLFKLLEGEKEENKSEEAE